MASWLSMCCIEMGLAGADRVVLSSLAGGVRPRTGPIWVSVFWFVVFARSTESLNMPIPVVRSRFGQHGRASPRSIVSSGGMRVVCLCVRSGLAFSYVMQLACIFDCGGA